METEEGSIPNDPSSQLLKEIVKTLKNLSKQFDDFQKNQDRRFTALENLVKKNNDHGTNDPATSAGEPQYLIHTIQTSTTAEDAQHHGSTNIEQAACIPIINNYNNYYYRIRPARRRLRRISQPLTPRERLLRMMTNPPVARIRRLPPSDESDAAP